MVVFTTLMVFGLVSFGVPRKHLQGYMILASLCISSLYLFYTPNPTWDIARHYEALHALRKCDFLSVLTGNLKTTDWFLQEYANGSRIYLIYAYIIGLFQLDGLLPAITGFIIYSTISRIIIMSTEDLGGEVEDWKVSFCFFFLLAVMDFRSISGIRNMLAYALFAYVLYMDLVRKKNRILCIAAYVLIANIHASAYILFALRLILFIRKKGPMWIIAPLVLIAYTFLDILSNFLMRFSHIPAVLYIIHMIKAYSDGGGTQYAISAAGMSSITIIYLISFTLTILYLLIYSYTRRKISIPSPFYEFHEYYLLIILFTFGAFRQYDILVRNNMILYFLVYPYLVSFMKRVVCETPLAVNVQDSASNGVVEIGVYAMIAVIIAFSLIMYMAGFYPPMDRGFAIVQ